MRPTDARAVTGDCAGISAQVVTSGMRCRYRSCCRGRTGVGPYRERLPPAADYQLVAWSGQDYASKQSCADELHWIKDNASLIMIYDCTGE